MKKLDPAVVAELEAKVHELERLSSVELVLEVRGRSGGYGHATARAGALVAFLGLLALLISPIPVGSVWLALDVLVLYAIGHGIALRSNAVKRVMTSKTERASQVRTAAAALFYERGIANTKGETGLLLYLSLLERRMEMIADRGVLRAVPAIEWNQISARVSSDCAADLKTLAEVMDLLTPLLEQRLPATGDSVDELPNAPRFEVE